MAVLSYYKEAGISGKSNHSLRATGASRLYQRKFPEKNIQMRTAHKTVGGLRMYMYERPGLQQEREKN